MLPILVLLASLLAGCTASFEQQVQSASTDTDTDLDGVTDNVDTDDDNDGIPDLEDPSPLDAKGNDTEQR